MDGEAKGSKGLTAPARGVTGEACACPPADDGVVPKGWKAPTRGCSGFDGAEAVGCAAGKSGTAVGEDGVGAGAAAEGWENEKGAWAPLG